MRQLGSRGWLVILATLLGSGLVVGIGLQLERETNTAEQASNQQVLSVGVAIGRGGLGDRSFNDSANAGLIRAQQELNIRSRLIELERDLQEANLRTLAREGHDLVIALGQEYMEPIQVVAAEFPEQRFALLDSEALGPNITSITFRELEGDFLAGALAALLSENDTVGFLGGASIPIVRRIEHGWRQGVRYIKPDARILREYAGEADDFSAFAKPELGLELTTRMYQQGADVVYAAAGRTALGAIEAAANEGKLVITTGSDQRYLNPGVVITSRTKNMDVAMYTLLEELRNGTLEAGTRVLDISTNGVGLAPLGAPLVSPQIRTRIEEIRQQLADGSIVLEEWKPDGS